jgi:hypothetical protein
MAELIALKNEVKQLLKSNERCDIDKSKILKVYKELNEGDEIVVTPEAVYEKLIELHPEKKCFNNCKKVSDDEFINNF